MFEDDDLLPVSALQHLLFCERQCALIHIERLWVENRWTADGRRLHVKVHAERKGPRDGGLQEGRRGVRTVRNPALRSQRLGLFGVADVVEFRTLEDGEVEVVPVEYKRGRPKRNDCDRVQLCAQAMCLEEMLAIEVGRGQVFYGRVRRRYDVDFDSDLRRRTEKAAAHLHDLVRARCVPRAQYEKTKCDKCSLVEVCMPKAMRPIKTAGRYLRQVCLGLEGAEISDALWA